ncbi:hypothetical protein KY358_06060 [Candidatus Woesearchaeota archaeon]|nr:hypothetical protein [Candidatus Woesearchaeota archaeon]
MQRFQAKDVERLKNEIERFSKKYKISSTDVARLFERDKYLPISIFNSRLSPFETIVKFFRENRDMKFKEISSLLNKEISACWTAYKNSKRKSPKKLAYSHSKYNIPLKDLFSDKLSLLELISCYLRDQSKLNFHTIGKILHRDERTIWTAYNRALRKNG